jgi:hypothetical protein
MVRGTLGMFGPLGQVTEAHLPFLAFIERAQAFSLGAIAMIESGNPLAAATLLRSFAENLAVVFYINAHPAEIDKLQPGARQGIKIGRIISQAEKHFPGFKGMYEELSSMAHPSGAGSYHTLKADDEGAFTWQSYPTFHSLEDARHFLRLLDELSDLTANVVKNTARDFESGGRSTAS